LSGRDDLEAVRPCGAGVDLQGERTGEQKEEAEGGFPLPVDRFLVRVGAEVKPGQQPLPACGKKPGEGAQGFDLLQAAGLAALLLFFFLLALHRD